jgi:hypothetical protein
MTICMIRTAAISPTMASFTNRRACVTCDWSSCTPADFNVDAGGEFGDELAPAVVTVQDLMQE